MGLDGTHEELCKNEKINKVFLEKLDKTGRDNKLNGLERLKKIYLESESLVLKGLTTTTLKIIRAKCKEYYKDVIE